MELNIQIISMMFSIIYGCILGILYNLNYNFLYKTLLGYKLLINILFSTDVFLIYFVILLKINNGNMNVPFLILLFSSFIITVCLTKNIRRIVKYFKNKKKPYPLS